jgi:hypothetical protein
MKALAKLMKQGDIQLLGGLSSRAVVGWGKHSARLDEKTRAHKAARSRTAPDTHCPCRQFLCRRRTLIAS